MPAHLIKRRDRGSIYYLADGALLRSLRTTSRSVAEHLLREYVRGKFGIRDRLTVEQYYRRWIARKVEPLVRASWRRNVIYHFERALLASIGNLDLGAVTVTVLHELRAKLLVGRKIKTVRNIMDASLRSMWREALSERVVEHDPFVALSWPRRERLRPDPFSAAERDRILDHCARNDPFWWPWIVTLFHTGMRPSEASALRWSDVDIERARLSIWRSRHGGDETATKTRHSERTIGLPRLVVDALRGSMSRRLGKEYVFINKFGEPIHSKQWSKHYWSAWLAAAGVRHRKFYATRHTFITEAVRAGHSLKAIADYCGTSVVMIEQDYCARLALAVDATVLPPPSAEVAANYAESLRRELVAGPGFEPVSASARKGAQVLTMELNYKLRRRKSA